MSDAKLSFSSRLILAFVAFWRTLVDAEFAAGVHRISRGDEAAMAPEPPTSAAAEAPAPRLLETDVASALQLLGLLQQEGRFVDFLQEDVAGYSDAEVGGAARVVHEGCRRALGEHLKVTPVRTEEEGTKITLQQGFSPSDIRLTGNVVGEPPFTGTLMHRGWRAEELHLPKLAEGHEVRVLAPAEVEL